MPWSLNRITEEVTKLKRALPLTFDWYTGRTQPPVEQQQIIFWEDVDDEVAKILMRRGAKTYVFTSYVANPGSNSTTILLDNHAHRHATSGSVKTDTGLDPVGPYNFTWTGAHTYTPLSNTVPIKINASASLTSANMQTWNPLSGFDTVVTRAGNVGIGDEVPTANLSMRLRSTDVPLFIKNNAYAWWDCGDIDGNGTNNAAYTDGQSDITAQVDKTGNGHNLASSAPSSFKWILHKVGGALPGPNNTAWLTPKPGQAGNWLPWTGSAFGQPAGWTAFIVVAITAGTLPTTSVYFLRGEPIAGPGSANVTCNIPDGDFGINPEISAYVNPGIGGSNHTIQLTTGTPTPWLAQSAEWYSFSWRYNGVHNGWNQGVAMASFADNGGTAPLNRSSWDRIFQTTAAGSITGYTYSEIILFNMALSETDRQNVQNYLDIKYGGSASTSVSTPLTHWKNVSGVVDSVVDTSLNFGFGTAANAITAKLHLISVTEQLRIGYDPANYVSVSTGATGGTTLDVFGTNPAITIVSTPTKKVGFHGATPIVQDTGWNVSNADVDRAFDASSLTVNELADVVGTLINKLTAKGLLGA